jgi:pyruvate-formate lyase-activating enzyme
MTFNVEILNPKAEKLLLDLADLRLIDIKDTDNDGFLTLIKKLKKNPPTMEEITKEVEIVRASR